MTEEQQLTEAMSAYADRVVPSERLNQAWNEHLTLAETVVGSNRSHWRTPLLVAAAVVLIGVAGATAVTVTHRSTSAASVNSAAKTATSCTPTRSMKIDIVGSTPGVDPSTLQPGSAQTLVPGTPISAIVCRYDGYGTSQPGKLATSTALATTETHTLAVLFNNGTQTVGGTYNCPIDLQDITLVTFKYAEGPNVQVSYDASSCQFATNSERTATTTSELRQKLASL